MINKVSILGCGWLGFPLAKYLIQQGFQVKGSTTHEDKKELLKQNGIEPFVLNFKPSLEGEDVKRFLDSDLLIINIPPGVAKHPANFHVDQMKALKKAIDSSSVKYIIYVSATSVYPESGAVFKEEDVQVLEKAENKTLFSAEELFRMEKGLNVTVLRCAGLVGYDRNPIKYFAGKTNVKAGNAPVNLIHRDDVIQIINSVIKNNYWNQTLNISSPKHPLRKDFYVQLAERYHYAKPQYDLSDTSTNKIVSIEKLIRDLNYSFKFPDPVEFFYE